MRKWISGLFAFLVIASTVTISDTFGQGFDPVAVLALTAQIDSTGIPDDVTNGYVDITWTHLENGAGEIPPAPAAVDFSSQGSTVTNVLLPAEGVYLILLTVQTGREFQDGSREPFRNVVRQLILTVAPESERPADTPQDTEGPIEETGFDGWSSAVVCIAEVGCGADQLTIYAGDGLGN